MRRRNWFWGVPAATVIVSAIAAGSAGADPPLELSGFASGSYRADFDRRASEFVLDQAEIDAVRELSPRGSVRVDLEWVWNGVDWAAAVEQGYMVYRPRGLGALSLTGGRFNAPMGFESLDPPDMYQISHGLLFDYCAPSNLTGAMVGLELGRGLDARAYATNGWDVNSENNRSPTFGGRLAWAGTGKLSGGVSAITGTRDPAQRLRESVLDVDLAFTPSARLLLGAELNGCRAERAGSDASWAGFMVMAHWSLLESLGLTGRYDLVNDNNDLLFGSGLSERRSSATVASMVTLGPGMLWFTELRLDMSDADVFVDHDGKARSSALTGALSMTYRF